MYEQILVSLLIVLTFVIPEYHLRASHPLLNRRNELSGPKQCSALGKDEV